MRLPKALTFDVFGTIVDWESAVSDFFREYMDRKGIDTLDPRLVGRRWEDIQFDYIRGEYKKYREVLRDTMKMTSDEFDLGMDEHDCDSFAGSMGRWKTYPGAVEALHELKKYTKIALITNTDNVFIEETVRRFGFPELDDIVTAEIAKSYKPCRRNFDLSQERLGLSPKDIMHVGNGFRYDVVPGKALGYEVCWVNWYVVSRPTPVFEDIMVGNLQTLASLIKLRALEEGVV